MKNNNDIKDVLREILLKYKCSYNKILKHLEYKYIMDYLNSLYDFPEDTMLKTKIFWALNDIHKVPLCLVCNKQLNINHIDFKHNIYYQYCCIDCANKSSLRINKIKNTNLQRYGVTSPAKNENIKQKIKNTCMKKYGTTCSFSVDIVKDKIKQTLLEKYGVEHPLQSFEVQAKLINTCMKKYGIPNGGGSVESIQKMKSTFISNYGVEWSWQSPKIQEKTKSTFLQKYGVQNYLQTGIPQKQSGIKRITDSYEQFILNNEYDEPMFSLEDYTKRSPKCDTLEFRCRKCNTIFQSRHLNGLHSRCPKCYPSNKSIGEIEVGDFIHSYDIQIKLCNRSLISPYELDIYIPSKSIAIEYDGLYYHSDERRTDRNYHSMKTDMCYLQNIQLIHIFENEWLFNKNIVKSRLLNLLGIYSTTIFAQNCDVHEINNDEAAIFFNRTCLQGYRISHLNIGLFYNDKVVAIMSFRQNDNSEKYQWELLQFSVELGCHIPDAAAKLLKYFERTYHPKSLISYVDRRWNTGKMHRALGFILDHISSPNYLYWNTTNKNILFSSNDYQIMKNDLIAFNDKLSDVENLKNNGCHIIYDAGDFVFVKQYN